ncbi:MAG: hypothetical protein ACHQ7M_05795 [Chloroflexota bacterium]
MPLPEKIGVPPERWDRLFAPSLGLATITTVMPRAGSTPPPTEQIYG